jgi:hypothetical protein
MGLRIEKDGREITSVERWFELAPPKKGKEHWQDGRSAKELAKAFIPEGGVPGVPAMLSALLASNDNLGAVEFSTAFPEYVIRLDDFPGETRNADLAAVGASQMGKACVNVEAKADEAFGNTVAEELRAARSNPKSNVPKRIDALAKALFGRSDDEIGVLRYQLLHGMAAALIFAKEQDAKAAVFAVLEFHGPKCEKGKLERNSRDFEAFVKALSHDMPAPTAGQVLGPIDVPGEGRVPSDIPLFVGKAVIELSS